jgi:phosphotriesterase-related protein
MPTVETVRGPVAADSLGRTLPHEHVFILGHETLANFNHRWGEAWWDEETGVAHAVAELQRLRAAGFETLVDPTAVGLGRDVGRIRRVNEQVDLNIVVATGIFAFMELPQFFRYRTADELAAFFVADIERGLDGTSVKAALIKCAVEEYGVVGDVPLVLDAVGIAHRETGVPVMVHTNSETRSGLLALDELEARGVDPSRVVVAHAGDSNDLDYLRAMAARGAFLGLDRFGGEHRNSDEQRIETLRALLADGLAEQLHISHDGACFLDFLAGDTRFAATGVDLHLDYELIPRTILPALRNAGVTQEQIDAMLVRSPVRFFAA